MNNDFETKIRKIHNIIEIHKIDGILFEKQNNIAWLMRGRSFISIATEIAICSILVTSEKVYLITNNIEAERLMQEEFPGVNVDVRIYYWYEENRKNIEIGNIVKGGYLKDSDLEHELKPLRMLLTEQDMKLYRQLGEDTASIIEEVCYHISPGMSENEVAGIIGGKCIERGMVPQVILVAADDRIMSYRHPLPTNKTISDYVMLVIGARRHGQICCITRFVSFGIIPEELRCKKDACMKINAYAIGMTRPGKNTLDVFRGITSLYDEFGYINEWKLHHQGGYVGYKPREYKITPDISIQIKHNQVFAWNPSITGFKCEDTFLTLDNGNEIITLTNNLPYKDIKLNNATIRVADILQRKKGYYG